MFSTCMKEITNAFYETATYLVLWLTFSTLRKALVLSALQNLPKPFRYFQTFNVKMKIEMF